MNNINNVIIEKPRVSVIIPAYNCETIIPATIKSVLAQTLKNIEIIIIDDGSTDNTLDVIHTLVRGDDRVKVLSVKNGGPAKARNIGINTCDGDYLCFLDSDDDINENMLLEMFTLCRDNALDICTCGYNMKNSSNNSEKLFLYKDFISTSRDDFRSHLMPLIKSHLMYVVWNKMFRRMFVIENHINFTDFLSGEDRLFNIQTFKLVERFAFLNKPFYNYYLREQSLNSKYISNRFESVLKAHLDLMWAFKNMGEYTTKNRSYINFVFIKSIMSCFCQLSSHACPLSHKQKLAYIKSTLTMSWVKEAITTDDDEFAYSRYVNSILRTGNPQLIYMTAKAIFFMQTKFSDTYHKIKHNRK